MTSQLAQRIAWAEEGLCTHLQDIALSSEKRHKHHSCSCLGSAQWYQSSPAKRTRPGFRRTDLPSREGHLHWVRHSLNAVERGRGYERGGELERLTKSMAVSSQVPMGSLFKCQCNWGWQMELKQIQTFVLFSISAVYGLWLAHFLNIKPRWRNTLLSCLHYYCFSWRHWQ